MLECARFSKVSGLSEEVEMSACAHCTMQFQSARRNLSAPCEICRPILARQLILWPELKVATALDSLSAIIKHKTEESRGRKDTVQWQYGFGHHLQIQSLLCIIFLICISIKGWILKLFYSPLLNNELCSLQNFSTRNKQWECEKMTVKVGMSGCLMRF